RDWSSDVCSSDLPQCGNKRGEKQRAVQVPPQVASGDHNRQHGKNSRARAVTDDAEVPEHSVFPLNRRTVLNLYRVALKVRLRPCQFNIFVRGSHGFLIVAIVTEDFFQRAFWGEIELFGKIPSVNHHRILEECQQVRGETAKL